MELKHDSLERARAVVPAAGGLLGLGNKVSAKKRTALDAFEQAFQ